MAKRTGRAGTETSGSRIEGQIDAGSGSCQSRSETQRMEAAAKEAEAKEKERSSQRQSQLQKQRQIIKRNNASPDGCSMNHQGKCNVQ